MKKYYHRFFDLLVIVLICIGYLLLVETEAGISLPALRLFVSIPILFYCPGYLLVLVIFHNKVDLNGFERFGLSLVLSMSILVFEFLSLDWMGVYIYPDLFSYVHIIIFIPLMIFILIRRRREPDEKDMQYQAEGKYKFIYLIMAIVIIASFSYSLWINKTQEKFNRTFNT